MELLLSFIISVILIICFFIMGKNITSIRKHIVRDSIYYYKEFQKYDRFGVEDKAKEALMSYIWERKNEIDASFTHSLRKGQYDAFKKKVHDLCDKYNLSVEKIFE